MERLNLHVDEAGNQDLSEGLYLVSVVLHDHGFDVTTPIRAYEERLQIAGLEDVPFHGKDLLHGHGRYESVSTGDRKRLLAQFARLTRSLPIEYFVLRYSKMETHDRRELEARIRRDLASLVFDHLSHFQKYDTISVYYDDGQRVLSVAVSRRCRTRSGASVEPPSPTRRLRPTSITSRTPSSWTRRNSTM